MKHIFSSNFTEFKDSIVCMEDNAKSDEMKKCSEDIRSKVADQDIIPELISCRYSNFIKSYGCMSMGFRHFYNTQN